MRQVLLKAGVLTPRLVVSTAVFIVVFAAVPNRVGAVLLLGGPLLAVVLALGWWEPLAARVVFFSRPIRAGEVEVIAPAVARLCQAGLGLPVVRLRVKGGVVSVGAAGFGRRTVIISSGLIEAVEERALPQGQAAAVMAHAATAVTAGRHRFDAVIAYWCLPWRMLAVVCAVGAALVRCLPFAALAWRIRGVVLLIAIAQFCEVGEYGFAAFMAVLAVTSYGLPVCQAAWQRELDLLGDRDVARVGLGEDLAAFLRRCAQTPQTRARIKALRPPAWSRQLGVVATETGGVSPAGPVR